MKNNRTVLIAGGAAAVGLGIWLNRKEAGASDELIDASASILIQASGELVDGSPVTISLHNTSTKNGLPWPATFDIEFTTSLGSLSGQTSFSRLCGADENKDWTFNMSGLDMAGGYVGKIIATVKYNGNIIAQDEHTFSVPENATFDWYFLIFKDGSYGPMSFQTGTGDWAVYFATITNSLESYGFLGTFPAGVTPETPDHIDTGDDIPEHNNHSDVSIHNNVLPAVHYNTGGEHSNYTTHSNVTYPPNPPYYAGGHGNEPIHSNTSTPHTNGYDTPHSNTHSNSHDNTEHDDTHENIWDG
jgi:hypothetical protein